MTTIHRAARQSKPRAMISSGAAVYCAAWDYEVAPATATATEVEELEERYRRGTVSDVDVKARGTVALNGFLDPIRERRARYAGDRRLVREAVVEVTQRVCTIA